MKNIGYILICGILVFSAVSTRAEKWTHVYSGRLRYNSAEKAEIVKKEFSDILNTVYYVHDDSKLIMMPRPIPKDKVVVVTTDSVTFNISKNRKFTFLCANKQEIEIMTNSGSIYKIDLPGLLFTWQIKDLESAKKFADDLVYFQNMGHFAVIKDVKDFDAIAAKYRTLKEKPPVSEEERKYIVQANAQTQMKNYKQAIELYEKAIEVDPTNPLVYNNEALLLAVVGQFDGAINSMKKYLMLVPEASDARAAQDKIYEWEAMVPK